MSQTNTFPIFDRLPPVVDAKASITTALLQIPPSISPRYFYDEMGCALYEAITCLPEYYPTKTEVRILESALPRLKKHITPGTQMIDLGSGDSAKAGRLLLPLEIAQYVAVDIARSAIEASLPRLQKLAPHVRLSGVVTDFAHTLNLADLANAASRLFFYPGSSIGNFQPSEALAFLQRIRTRARPMHDWLLIGVDSVKEIARLNLAYDDPLGVTAAFNLNVLRHVNRIADTDFDVSDWKHRSFFNPTDSRVEMHLEAIKDVNVRVGGNSLTFAKGARIHTENSYKYARETFGSMLGEAGFDVVEYVTDANVDFHVFLARAR